MRVCMKRSLWVLTECEILIAPIVMNSTKIKTDNNTNNPNQKFKFNIKPKSL